jgi:hypothetical protein
VRVVVTGWVAGFPTAGFLWHPLQFALGFAALGHEVWFLDDVGDEPWGWDPVAQADDPTCAAGARWLEAELAALGDRPLAGWCVRNVPHGRTWGMTEADLLEVLAAADLLVDVSLTLPRRPEHDRVPCRIGIDTDPGFTQVRVARGDALLAPKADDLDRLFSFGRPPLPAARHEWVPTRQPVDVGRWVPGPPPPPGAPLTTLTTWQAYEPVEWDGCAYAAKDRSFEQLLGLPERSPAPIAVALGAGRDHRRGVEVLGGAGFQLLDPGPVSATTASYRRFIARSLAELGVAKHGYVVGRSGWFSERTALYLASGRPAVVQDTGWSRWLPSGEGLLAYDDAAGAAAAIGEVLADWDRHAAAARRLAVERFDAAVVCSELLQAL